MKRCNCVRRLGAGRGASPCQPPTQLLPGSVVVAANNIKSSDVGGTTLELSRRGRSAVEQRTGQSVRRVDGPRVRTRALLNLYITSEEFGVPTSAAATHAACFCKRF